MLTTTSDASELSILIAANAIPDEDTQKYYAQFLSKIWVTKGCRFAANTRLSGKSLASQITISVLSVYVIAGSLVTLVSPAGALTQAAINAINLIFVVTSIFILVLSNIEAGKNYALRAHVMLKCAQKVAELYNDIEFLIRTKQMTTVAFNERVKLYDKIIADFSDNHDDIDFLCFQVDHWKHFSLSGFKAYRRTITRRALSFLGIWGYYFAMLLPPPILFYFVITNPSAWLR
jgi:hypothetical protein